MKSGQIPGDSAAEFISAYRLALDEIEGMLASDNGHARLMLSALVRSHLLCLASIVGLDLPDGSDASDRSDPSGRAIREAATALVHERLLSRFTFSPHENDAPDSRVAVDPGVFSRAFEASIADRHDSGAYYTPGTIVSYMCRQALKGYLTSCMGPEYGAAVDEFVDDGDSSGLPIKALARDALLKVRVCDPSCGGGEFLVGMLQEILRLLDALPPTVTRALGPDLQMSLAFAEPPADDEDKSAARTARITDNLVGIERNPLAAEIAGFRLRLALALRSKSPSACFRETIPDIRVADCLTTPETALAGSGFDIVLANPPYVRADARFQHIEDPEERRREVALWRKYRASIASGGAYETLYDKWDLYIPFIERGYQLLRPGGHAVFIVPDALNSAKYALKSREFLLANSRIERVDLCDEIDLFESGVHNTILHFSKRIPDSGHRPTRIRRWGDGVRDFDRNQEILPTDSQETLGQDLFRVTDRHRAGSGSTVPLGRICYISYGLRANSDEKRWPGLFVTEDCVSPVKDERHPAPFVRGKDYDKWLPDRILYLEWGTERAPRMFSRPTFVELHCAPEKLIAARTPNAAPRVIFDDASLRFDTSSVGFVPWTYLREVRNNSIRKTAKYADEDHTAGAGPREELETLSEGFPPKYLLAVMNSAWARDWLAGRRRSKLHIYPDDWKSLPIPIPPEDRLHEVLAIVDSILRIHAHPAHDRTENQKAEAESLERRIDELISELYG